MEMVNVHYLAVLQHAWMQGGRCQRTIRFKKGFLPNSIPPNTELRGGEWIGSSKSSYAAPNPGTFDALASLELFGTLRTHGDEGGTQLLREESSTSKPDLDKLMKTGSESIEATLCRRRIFFAGFVARMEDTRLPKCVILGEMMGGVGCVGDHEKEWIGCFLDDLRAFAINAHEWTIAAQDEGGWHRVAEQGAKRFMAKWIAAEKARARLRYAVVVCPNVTGRTNERVAQSKRVRAGLLAIVD